MKKSLLLISFTLCLGKEILRAQDSLQPAAVLQVMEKVADWQLLTWQQQGMRWPAWDWTNGACYTGFVALDKVAGDRKYSLAMRRIGDSIGWNTGPRRMLADDYCVGQLFAELYGLYKDERMIRPFRALADSIVTLPHNESLEWKNDIYLREWAWCDALFMGPPALACLTTATGDRKYLDMADKLWWKTTDYLYDPHEHLFTRDSRYFTQREANGKKMFWARGNGWVMAGLVRMLENMPSDDPRRTRYIGLFKEMAAKVASLQQPDGSWHTALLDPDSYPAKETSGTGFYCYALTYGLRKGYLKDPHYYLVAKKAWQSLVSAVHPDGMLGYVQPIGEKPGAVDYNSTEVYGVGALLLAGAEWMQFLLQQRPY
ncbi:MAG TPA: glycoside hydrolase family 88 protein [Puia sp.]|jgi:rhamnogalacturonyl hydrolase YesR|nr:glycoside hydrolase family 88 protein [Puia sp.]